MIVNLVFSCLAIAGSISELVKRYRTGFKRDYLPMDAIVAITALLAVIAILARSNFAIAYLAAAILAIWLYITWRDWGRRNRQKALKLLGDKSRRALAKLNKAMPRSKPSQLTPQPSPA